MCLVPLTEWGGVDLDDGGLGEGVGSDQLVVRRVVGDNDHADLAGDALAAPGEVAGVDTQGAELAVAATGADEVDALGTDTCVGGLATLLESSADTSSERHGWDETFGLCTPLLAIVCALGTRGAALVTRVTRDTVKVLAGASMEVFAIGMDCTPWLRLVKFSVRSKKLVFGHSSG